LWLRLLLLAGDSFLLVVDTGDGAGQAPDLYEMLQAPIRVLIQAMNGVPTRFAGMEVAQKSTPLSSI